MKFFADEFGVLGAEPLGVGVMEDPAYQGCNQGEASPFYRRKNGSLSLQTENE